MKFLIQTKNRKIVYDFAFILLQSIDYHNWLNENSISYKLTDDDLKKDHTPIGSIEFVHSYMEKYFGFIPKPINIPDELLDHKYSNRTVFNGTKSDIKGYKFIKSNEVLKGQTFIINTENNELCPNMLTSTNYQISEVIDIQSEYRCFVYQNKLVGIQYYSGDFTIFPDVNKINSMIEAYKSSPISYTLDIGVNETGTFIIECHNFYSVGLYGFNDLKLLPLMFNRWFYEYKCNILEK